MYPLRRAALLALAAGLAWPLAAQPSGQSIALAGKMISARVNRAGLSGMLGETGETNIQGEFVQKLDRYADETFISALEHRGHTCMVVSEERDEPILIPAQWHSGCTQPSCA